MPQSKRRRSLRSGTLRHFAISKLNPGGEERPLSRKISSPNEHNTTGYFPSFKTRYAIPCESGGEFNYLHFVEFDGEISDIRPQPGCLHLTIEGKLVKHYPDFLVTDVAGNQRYVEVKNDKDVDSEEWKVKATAATAAALALGCGYELLKNSAVRVQPRLNNLTLLYRYREVEVSASLLSAILSLLEFHSLRISDLATALGRTPGDTYMDCLSLVGKGQLHTDMDAPLTKASFMSRPR